MSLGGRYYAKTITTAGADEDIMATLRTASGDTSLIQAKKITIITQATITVSINGSPFSDMYVDLDGVSRLSLDGGDVYASHIVVHQSGIILFVAIIY